MKNSRKASSLQNFSSIQLGIGALLIFALGILLGKSLALQQNEEFLSTQAAENARALPVRGWYGTYLQRETEGKNDYLWQKITELEQRVTILEKQVLDNADDFNSQPLGVQGAGNRIRGVIPPRNGEAMEGDGDQFQGDDGDELNQGY